MKNNRQNSVDTLIMLSTVKAKSAAELVREAKQIFVDMVRSVGEEETREIVRGMSVEEVEEVEKAFKEVVEEVDQIKDFFHEARKP